jgi:hypothetical protein
MEGQNNINISLDKTTSVSCNNCNGRLFNEGIILQKVSKFISGTSQDALIPINVMYCVACKKVLEETLPIQLKNQKDV